MPGFLTIQIHRGQTVTLGICIGRQGSLALLRNSRRGKTQIRQEEAEGQEAEASRQQRCGRGFPARACGCRAMLNMVLFLCFQVSEFTAYDARAVLAACFVLQLQEVHSMSQNDLETPAYEPEAWRSTTQGLGALYSRKSTMAVVSTETRRTAATASSLREKSRSLAMSS